jgi:hypothetical protein
VAVASLPFAYNAAFSLVCQSPFWAIDSFSVTQLNGYVFPYMILGVGWSAITISRAGAGYQDLCHSSER